MHSHFVGFVTRQLKCSQTGSCKTAPVHPVCVNIFCFIAHLFFFFFVGRGRGGLGVRIANIVFIDGWWDGRLFLLTGG